MKIPKNFRTYCPSCKKHTVHTVERVKKAKASSLTHITRQKERRTGIGNSGKFSKVPGGDKPTKKVNLRYRCNICKKAHVRPCFRAGKFELKE
ncbi:MAG: large subunit ribosomal protein L44e [Candidatus Argoarchaeum ethanivorans]|uniref:Large ribosomal subunit protein eL42 n=1 Tax=Candidatus Argoarchaeum ethanivorans TaxID=2608793 RepID=A0A8B3S6S9_9EURY|nr:MAG: large subunit ribosomal protein L44e [Candidatus Argoarchaeum ethanivorans]CAD6492243.1 MAG: 50S ribosomal protein L44e [Candidatus Argoarchaeum ethanivorans]